jgi:hypothetical protein
VAELELVPVGFAVEPVARPLQVLEAQVPNVDQPVGVENADEEEVDAASAGVELELEPVLHALPQPQLEDEDDEVRLELEIGAVLEADVDVETGLNGNDVGEL